MRRRSRPDAPKNEPAPPELIAERPSRKVDENSRSANSARAGA
jgi:hypothetical protein